MVKDTSKNYEHMLEHVAETNLNRGSLDEFLGIEKEYKPEVRKKERDPEFPEQWQSLFVSFSSFETYAEFMKKIDSAPSPKLKELVYQRPEARDMGILAFFGDE